MRKIFDEEQAKRIKNHKMYLNAKTKKWVFNYADFEIHDYCWKHKSWKTWCKGLGTYYKTVELVARYIKECSKPFGNRDLSFVHLVTD